MDTTGCGGGYPEEMAIKRQPIQRDNTRRGIRLWWTKPRNPI